VALILNVFVPLSLVVFVPVLVNIVGLGLTIMKGGLRESLPMVAATLYLLARNFRVYRPLLRPTGERIRMMTSTS
jgi:hypothetical protein